MSSMTRSKRALFGKRFREIRQSLRIPEFYREEAYRADVMAALEAEFGPRHIAASSAVPVDGEDDGGREVGFGEFAMTLGEVAEELGLSRERVRQIEAGALRSLRETLTKQLTGAEREMLKRPMYLRSSKDDGVDALWSRK